MRLRLLLLALLLAGAGPALALSITAPSELAEQLRVDPVVVEDGAQVPLDADAVRAAVAGSAVRVYVLGVSAATADAAGGAQELVTLVGQELGDSDSVVVVVSEDEGVYAGNGRVASDRGVDAATAMDRALAAGGGGAFTEEAVTAVVLDVVRTVDAQARGESTGSGPGGTSGGTSGGSSALPWLLGAGALGAGAYGLARSRGRRRAHAQAMEDLRADVESLYGRLGSDVQTLAPGDDDVARQALADAAERYNATGALMATADSEGEWAAARRTAVEGLTAARVVRTRLGLDPGPEIPMNRSGAPQLSARQVVEVGDERYEGAPDYEPGRPHYFEGGTYEGRVLPGGWYATPFWQTLLLGSLLGGRRGGFGGGFGGPVRRRGPVLGGGRRGGSGWGGGRVGGGSWGGGRRGGRGGSW